jgi:hypothetical protein
MDFSFDWRAPATAMIVSLLAALAAGLLPALQATRGDVSMSLKTSAPVQPGLWRYLSLRNIVVTNQVMVSTVLLSLTGFIVVGFGRSTTVDLGFNTHNLYLLNLDPVRNGLAPTEAAQKVELLRQRLQQMQGTTAVSLAQGLPVAFTSGESIAASKMELVEGAGAAGVDSLRQNRRWLFRSRWACGSAGPRFHAAGHIQWRPGHCC